MAQVYTRPLMEARMMDQTSPDILKKKNYLLKVLWISFIYLFAVNLCKNYSGQYTNAQTLTK